MSEEVRSSAYRDKIFTIGTSDLRASRASARDPTEQTTLNGRCSL